MEKESGATAPQTGPAFGVLTRLHPSNWGLPDWFWRAGFVFFEWVVPSVLLGLVGVVVVALAVEGKWAGAGFLVAIAALANHLTSAYYGPKVRRLKASVEVADMVIDCLRDEMSDSQLERARAALSERGKERWGVSAKAAVEVAQRAARVAGVAPDSSPPSEE